MLTRRLEILPVYEKAAVIAAAKQLNLKDIVLAALKNQHAYIRAVAATTLQHLPSDLDRDTIIGMLHSEDWVLRWQALIVLKKHLKAGASGETAYIDLACSAIQILRDRNELNTVIRLALIELVELLGKRADTSLLPILQNDPELMIRNMANRVLETMGGVQSLRVTGPPSLLEQ